MSYHSYKPWLRDEFAFRCVYCLCRERWFPDGDAAFGVDHLIPQSEHLDLTVEYSNLVYSCCQCNSLRGTDGVPDPAVCAYGDHLEVLSDGSVKALSETGAYLTRACRLNRQMLVEFRLGILKLLNVLETKSPEHAEPLVRRFFGYPESLPNLRKMRPPLGTIKEGLASSSHERRLRGELPSCY